MEAFMEALLAQTEGEKLDFKWELNLEDDASRSAIVKLVAAMANSFDQSDAHIIVGVSNDKSGFQDVDIESVEERFQQSLAFLDPSPREVRLSNCKVTVQGKEYTLGLITIPFQIQRPLRVYKELGDLRSNAVYIRQGSTIRLASPEEIGRFLAERQVLVYGKAQLQEIKEELDKSPERGELLALEEKLRMDMERVQRQLIEIGADWEKLGKAIQNPRGILSIIFSNSDHGRAANIIGMGDLSINYQTMQSHRNVEKIKDLVSAWQALLVQLYQVQVRLKRAPEEVDLYKINGRY